MIGFLRGELLRAEPNVVLIDVRGVGYEVHVPLSTYYELERQEKGRSVPLYVHTHMRDDAISLFGFWTEHEKALFGKLIAVSGIGPRLALSILSGMPPHDLVGAIRAGDLRRLNTIPGVGKKTAERLVLELRDKVEALANPAQSVPSPAADSDLLLALLNLGYKRPQAARAIERVQKTLGEKPFPEQLRAALQTLSGA